MSACETTSRGQSVALGFATADIKEEGWVVQFAGREKKKNLRVGVPQEYCEGGALTIKPFHDFFFQAWEWKRANIE